MFVRTVYSCLYVRARTNFSVSWSRCIGKHDSDAKEKLVADGTVETAW